MSLNLALVITGDAAGAKRAANETEEAVQALGSEANRTAAAMVAANDQATASARRMTEALIGQTQAQRQMMQAVTGFANIRNPLDEASIRRRGEDIAAYGAELDRIRAKYNPLFAAIRDYKTYLAEIRRDQQLGAISADEMTAAIERQRTATLAQIAVLKNRPAGGAAGAGGGLAPFQRQNLAFQANDIVTMALMGAPLTQIAASQGGQVLQSLQQGEGGISGSLKGIKDEATAALGSIARFLGPAGIIATGFAVAGTAAFAFYEHVRGDAEKTNDILERHADLLKRIKAGWTDAASGESDYRQESQRILLFQDQLARDALARNRVSDIKAVVDPLYILNQRGQRQLQYQYQPLAGPIEQLQKDNDVQKFSQALVTIAQSNAPDTLKQIVNRLLEMTAAAREAQRALHEISRVEADLQSMESYRKFLVEDAARANQNTRQFNADVGAIGARSPAELAAAARARADANTPYDLSDRRQIIERAGALAQAEAERTLADAYEQRTRSLDQTLASQRLDLELIGKTAGEQARLRLEFQLTQQVYEEAARNHVEVDQAEIARIKEKAAAYGEVADAIAKTNLARDLQFERDQIGRSPIEAAVASRLKSAGLAVDLNSDLAGQIRMNEILKEQKKLWEDIRGVGLDAIDQITGSAADGFSNINDVLKSIAGDATKDLLQLAAANPIKNAIYGTNLPTLDGAGGLGGIFRTLLGGAAPAAASAIGGQAVADMTVTAAVVNINGAAVGGDLAGNVTKLLTGANDNANYAPGAVTRAPLGAAAPNAAVGTVATYAWEYFKGKGLSDAQVAGILGHMSAESAFKPGVVGDQGHALGLFQWNDRGPAMAAAVPDWRTNVKGQLDYAWKELNGPESATLARLRAATDVRSATRAFGGFERPQGWDPNNPEAMHNFKGRYEAAEAAFDKFKNKTDEATASIAQVPKATKEVANLGATAAGALQNLKSFGGSLDLLGQALSAGAGKPGGALSGLFGGGVSLASMLSISPAATAAIASGSWGLYDSGGPTGGYDPRRVAGLVHEREYVFDAPAVAALGVPYLDNLRRAAKSGRGYAEGGYATPWAGGGSSSAGGGAIGGNIFEFKHETVVHNYAGAKVRTEEEDDGKGGRRTNVIIEEQVAAAMNRRGSPANRALNARGARYPTVKR